jgi:hypothetical protein
MANSIDDFLTKSTASKEDKEGFKALLADNSKKASTPQNAAEALKTSERNDPIKGNEQTPQQAKTAQNAVDKALDRQTTAEVSQIGQTLAKEGVTAQPQDRER